MRYTLQLNEKELASPTRAHFLGSWCPDSTGFTFVSFLPNVLHRPNATTNMVFSYIGRARWITEEELGFDWDEHFAACFERKLQQLGLGENTER
jgi:hypothetical protein